MNQVNIQSVEQLLEELNRLPNCYIFRGHANAAWRLESSLERVVGQKWSKEFAKQIEEYSLSAFKSKFHLYDHENIRPESKLAWLSIMQHYGVPTRLLDFTESPYVALYFALELYNPQLPTDFAVFAIDYTIAMQKSIDYIAAKDADFKETRDSVYDKQDEVFEKTVDRFAYDILWIAEPKQLNVRLDRQAGSFLLSGNSGTKIEDILASQPYTDICFTKYCIPGNLYEGVFALLRKMNITSKSLYGNLDGLARSIHMLMKVYSI